MTAISEKTALIIIDVQDGMDDPVWGARNNPDAERNMARLLADWRAKGRPIYHIQHMSRRAASPLRRISRATRSSGSSRRRAMSRSFRRRSTRRSSARIWRIGCTKRGSSRW